MPAQVCFGSFLMTRARLSQVVPQRQQSGLPLPLHLVEWEELSGCAEKGKAHTGVMQQAAVGLAHSAKPLSRSVSSFAFCTRWLWRRASPGGEKKVFIITHKGTFPSDCPTQRFTDCRNSHTGIPANWFLPGCYAKASAEERHTKGQGSESQE